MEITKNDIRNVCLLFLLLLPLANFAQKRVVFHNLSMEDGLSQNSVISISQDKDQFLWFGTRHGLNRYDGFQFKVYKNDPDDPASISHHVVDCMLTDTKGVLWLGTEAGLNRYDRQHDNFIRLNHSAQVTHSISNDTVNCIYEDPHHQLWIGTRNGLNLLTDRKNNIFRKFYFNSPSHKRELNEIFTLFMDADGILWAGTGAGLMEMTMKNGKADIRLHKHTSKTNSIGANYITGICEDRLHNLWVATDKGLNLYHRKTRSFLSYRHRAEEANSLIHDDIRELILNQNGSLWIGTQEGLSVLDPQTRRFTNYKHDPGSPGSISQNSIHSIFQDRNGIVWLGSFYGGVDAGYLNSADFKNYSSSGSYSSISGNVISGIVEDADRNLWIGTEGGGLNFFNRSRNKYTHYKTSPRNLNSIPSNLVKTLFKDKTGKIFIGMHEGLVSIFNPADGSCRQLTNVRDTLNTRGTADIMTILEDSGGNVWIGSRDGLSTLVKQDGNFQNKTKKSPLEKRLKSKYVQTLVEDTERRLWIGTVKGLHIYDPRSRQLKIFQKKTGNKDSLQSDYINCIVQLDKDHFCIGTYLGGVSIFDLRRNKFSTYTEKDGLSNNNVLGIIKDDSGNLWISTDNGLSKFNPGTGKFKNYTKSDGLAGNEFNMRSFFKDSKGEFFFGGYNGLTSFYPDQIGINARVAPIVFTGLRIFNKPVRVNEPAGVLQQNITGSRDLTFQHDYNNFSLEFALLNYVKPDKNKYSYQLQGYDKEWISTNTPGAAYSNLAPGNYTFVVKGMNNDGTPGRNTAAIGIHILPPFWATWWAYLLYLSLFSGVLFITVRYFFVRALLKRSEDVQQMKLNFFTYVAHEIRTPLTLILGPLDSLVQETKSSPELNRQVMPIKNNANRLMRLVNELMDFRKAEAGHLRLHVSKGNLIDFSTEIFRAFEYQASTLHIQYSFLHEQDQAELFFDKIQLEKVMFNLISNAFKFSSKGGRIILSITEKEHEVAIEVTDNGLGIPYGSQQKLFTDFFQVNTGDANPIGSGIGLALSKVIVEAHQGTIDVVSHQAGADLPGHTCFTVRLKKGSAHFKPEQLEEAEGVYTSLSQYHQYGVPDFSAEPQVMSIAVSKAVTILIVEDNIEIMQLLSSSMCMFYNVKEAVNGLQGWEAAIELIPDLIICDIMMPVMDGLELCSKLKTDERTSHIPVILLTAKSSPIHQLSGMETGADAYMTKPFSMELLHLNVRNILQSRTVMRQKYIQQVNLQPEDITVNSTDYAFMTKVISYIETCMTDESFGVPELAAKIGMSQPVLYKKIRNMTTLSVNDFIKSIRLKKAAQLFRKNTYTISEVSYLVGFNDPKYFSREFKKQYQQTPRIYISNMNADMNTTSA